MDALILAAGFGSRLREVEPCKPLTQIGNMSLLEIGVRQLAAVGVKRCVVATGHCAEQIEAALPAIAGRTGIDVEARRVDDHRQPNGYSVMAGAKRLGEQFLLVMADHVFATPVLERLLEASVPENGVVLATDRRIASPLVDPDDATWVATDGEGNIVRIGKEISDYDRVDCGAFVATPALPQAIRAAIGEGASGSLSDGMQRLASVGLARAADIGEGWWLDVDDARALDLARKQAPAHIGYVAGARSDGLAAG